MPLRSILHHETSRFFDFMTTAVQSLVIPLLYTQPCKPSSINWYWPRTVTLCNQEALQKVVAACRWVYDCPHS